jgi:excisionase family DNA binding protein
MDAILTTDEVAVLLKISKRTVCKLMGEQVNPLPALKIGRSVRFRRADVDAWLATLTERKAA